MTDARRHNNHRGNPVTISPACLTELQHLWCHSTMPADRISTRLSAKYGQKIDAESHARRRGYERTALNSPHPAAVASRLALASLARWHEPRKPDDNAVRKPATRFAVPPGGFSMLRGRV
jgi:hypothetical protein